MKIQFQTAAVHNKALFVEAEEITWFNSGLCSGLYIKISIRYYDVCHTVKVFYSAKSFLRACQSFISNKQAGFCWAFCVCSSTTARLSRQRWYRKYVRVCSLDVETTKSRCFNLDMCSGLSCVQTDNKHPRGISIRHLRPQPSRLRVNWLYTTPHTAVYHFSEDLLSPI